MTITRTAARLALVGVAALSFAACSSSSSAKSDAKKAAATSTTTAASTPSCPTVEEATAALGAGNRATDTPICEGGFAAGDATGEVDFAYILQPDGDSWARVSDAVQTEICTTNPQGLSQQFVNTGCND
ncbi:MAG: hypothetical protein JJE46_16245 [Acidimicrobiia bacterium]|nr:hypothetical protein [Acidimicrobiia bacterium]